MEENTVLPTDSVESEVNAEEQITPMKGMFKEWFLDYASYVILERAVPLINDGLKPVHRRILHTMKTVDDGRYNKVANIIGQTMQYHPHGDRSIGDALITLGQKELLIDTQGNWGNTYTGDGAAAPRYIEARLTKFALEVLYSPKITEWVASYDGRNKEPEALPVKFPLLLHQGVEGIAVGLASKILPHNFLELIDASIAALKGKDFEIYPDFPTGGYIDVHRYNEGLRGGAVKVRAKISPIDNSTLVITELPFGKTTESLIESIIKANNANKIKIRKILDNTSDKVEILIKLPKDADPNQTIDALYAVTDCEISISPNSCVIREKRPEFLSVKTILRYTAEKTKELLKKELLVRKQELETAWHNQSLERIFIENRMYKDAEFENSKSNDAAIKYLDQRLDPFKPKLLRPIEKDDIQRLLEIRMARILKHNADKAEKSLLVIEDELKQVEHDIEHITEFAINYYKSIKKKYGKGHERKTEIRDFENIEVAKVVVANEKLYANFETGFIGTDAKNGDYICDCSDVDEIIVFTNRGTFKVFKVSNKSFMGKDVIHAAVFKKNDTTTIYNLIYRDGIGGTIYGKRFFVNGITRDKEYDLTKGTDKSKVLYFTANPHGEAEIIRVVLRPRPKLRKTSFNFDFSDLAIKGRSSQGNIVTKYSIHRIKLKEKGKSTLESKKIYFDNKLKRINYDGVGELIDDFNVEDRIIVFNSAGYVKFYNLETSNRFDDDLMLIEKYDETKVWSLIYFDPEKQTHHVKRFKTNPNNNGDRVVPLDDFKMVKISGVENTRFQVKFGGEHASKEELVIQAEEFIAVKGISAKGKILTKLEISSIHELEPLVVKDSEKETVQVKEKLSSLFDN